MLLCVCSICKKKKTDSPHELVKYLETWANKNKLKVREKNMSVCFFVIWVLTTSQNKKTDHTNYTLISCQSCVLERIQSRTTAPADSRHNCAVHSGEVQEMVKRFNTGSIFWHLIQRKELWAWMAASCTRQIKMRTVLLQTDQLISLCQTISQPPSRSASSNRFKHTHWIC